LVASLKEQVERSETRTSLSDYKLKRATEELETIREQFNNTSQARTITPVDNVARQSTPRDLFNPQEEPTLADISDAMDRHVTQPRRLEDASEILGRSIIEDDMQMIVGIDTEVQSILSSKGITQWADLAQLSAEELENLLKDTELSRGTHEPKTWIVQARMATRHEWRKLRVYQETLQ
jgi:predicted flap endonuclease-1-like 5' DNA nuclease